MNRGLILGKATEKSILDLQSNSKQFLKMKTKNRDSIDYIYKEAGFKISYTHDNISDQDNINVVNSLNQQLETDDIIIKHKKNKLNNDTINNECKFNSLLKSRDKKKLENDLGIDLYDSVDNNPEIELIRSKSTRNSKKSKRNIKNEDSIPIVTNKNSENLLEKDFIKFSNTNELISITKDISIDVCPWLTEKSKNLKGMLKLHQEIIDFYEFLKPTIEEDVLRDKTVNSLKELIKENWPEWRVKKFGSFPNKLHLPDSDVDIVIITDNTNPGDQLKILTSIEKKLYKNGMVDFIRVIEARVPIIRTRIKDTKINLDISSNRKNGYEAKKVIKKILEDFPYMRPLIYVLKYFLRQRKLNESYTGGISSFLLFNLLFSYIQYLGKNDQLKDITLGHILVGFFQFYAFDFNFEEVGISIRYGGFYYKKSEKINQDFKRNSLLSVENFQELDQDVGKASFKFRKVLDCFKHARDALYYPSQYPIVSYISLFITIDDFLKERQYRNLR